MLIALLTQGVPSTMEDVINRSRMYVLVLNGLSILPLLLSDVKSLTDQEHFKIPFRPEKITGI